MRPEDLSLLPQTLPCDGDTVLTSPRTTEGTVNRNMGDLMISNRLRRNFHPLWHLRKHPAFRWATRSIRINVGVRIKRVDHKVYVDLLRNPRMVSAPDAYERQDLDLMIDMIERLHLRTMFDIGANLGIYSFSFSAAAKDGRVVAFEPDVVNANLFNKTNARCPRRNIFLEQKVVAESPGSATFFTDEISGAMGSIHARESTFNERHYKSAPTRTTVAATTIDEAAHKFFPPDFIKIDVEGAEMAVLKGARQTLLNARPIMLIEIGSDGDLQGVREFLDEAGYVMRPASDPNYLAYPRHAVV
jgi:FkbM family methyltransferase